MVFQPGYWLIRARLSRLVLAPLFALLLYGGCYSYMRAGSHLTHSSVHVRGYFRRDGSYVRPYTRRPSGGVPHDAPNENTMLYTGLLSFASFLGLAIVVGRFLRAKDSDLLPSLRITSQLPPPPKFHFAPTARGTSPRATWCRECAAQIRAGDTVAFRTSKRGYPYTARAICLPCAARICRKRAGRIRAYEGWEALRDEEAQRVRALRTAHFKKHFGTTAEPPTFLA